METLKKLVIIIVIAVAGYFIYQNYLVSPPDEEEDSGVVESIPADELPAIPEKCQPLAKNLENAIYGQASHRSSFASRNTAYRSFQSCLREAGFSDTEIDGTVAQIETKVKGYLKQDGE
jgi:hypothetical protein